MYLDHLYAVVYLWMCWRRRRNCVHICESYQEADTIPTYAVTTDTFRTVDRETIRDSVSGMVSLTE